MKQSASLQHFQKLIKEGFGHTEDKALFPCLSTPFDVDFPTFELFFDASAVETVLADSNESGENKKIIVVLIFQKKKDLCTDNKLKVPTILPFLLFDQMRFLSRPPILIHHMTRERQNEQIKYRKKHNAS